MKKIYIAFFASLICLTNVFGQKTIDYSIRVSASVQKSPAQITLMWPKDPNATNYLIYRKLKGDASFGALRATMKNTDSIYVDNTNVSVGVNYEYEMVKSIKNAAYYGFGYISTGIELPVVENRGKLILIYDKALLTTLQAEINRLALDMTADGWIVVTHGVNKTDKVTDIHSLILSDYTADKYVKAVFLLGHIPVPYAGGDLGYGLNPIDGHDYRKGENPSHNGAWPADVYYGEMNGTWSDENVFDTLGTFAANHNVPGDGKFDNDVLPAKAVLAVGRVDMYNMPAFSPLTETDLIKRYLDKDHKWRMGQIPMVERGFVMDKFGGAEAFGASGYKNFSTFFGAANVYDSASTTWDKILARNSYLWSYACGPGDFVSAGGISSTTDYSKDSLQTVFTMHFGSFFGDWNVTNNYLRAALASKGPILTNCWSGRPQWQFHNMAMGDPISYSTLLNFNEFATRTTDYTNYFRSTLFGNTDRMTHVALLGDPTLRMHVVQPPSKLLLSHNKLVMTLNWTASTDPNILGYYVYRSSGLNLPFIRITANPISATTYMDNNALHNKNFYMVRAVKLQTSASGTYFNLSQGTLDTLTTDNSGIGEMTALHTINVFPNPGSNVFHISWPGTAENIGELQVSDIFGKQILHRNLSGLANLQTIDIDLSGFETGVYLVKLTNGKDLYMQRVVKE